jgi:hypothetical protein
MVVQVEDAELLVAVGVGDHSASPRRALTVISPLLVIHLLLVTHDIGRYDIATRRRRTRI